MYCTIQQITITIFRKFSLGMGFAKATPRKTKNTYRIVNIVSLEKATQRIQAGIKASNITLKNPRTFLVIPEGTYLGVALSLFRYSRHCLSNINMNSRTP
jgi:hypothetical protein